MVDVFEVPDRSWMALIRIDAEVDQETIARAMGVSVRTYQRWEADPDALPLARIMRVLVALDPDHQFVLVFDGDRRSIRKRERITLWDEMSAT